MTDNDNVWSVVIDLIIYGLIILELAVACILLPHKPTKDERNKP